MTMDEIKETNKWFWIEKSNAYHLKCDGKPFMYRLEYLDYNKIKVEQYHRIATYDSYSQTFDTYSEVLKYFNDECLPKHEPAGDKQIMPREEKIKILNNKKVKTADGFKIELWDKTISWRKMRGGMASAYQLKVEYTDGKGYIRNLFDDEVKDYILNEMDDLFNTSNKFGHVFNWVKNSDGILKCNPCEEWSIGITLTKTGGEYCIFHQNKFIARCSTTTGYDGNNILDILKAQSIDAFTTLYKNRKHEKSMEKEHIKTAMDKLDEELKEIIDSNDFINKDIFAEAQELISGSRHNDYGTAKDNFTDIGRIWGTLMGIPDIKPEMVGLMMAGLKIAREKYKHKKDNIIDGIGYLKLSNDIVEGK